MLAARISSYPGLRTRPRVVLCLVMCFFLGFGLIGRFACGYLLFLESIPEKQKTTLGTVFMTSDVIATLYITFFLRFISNSSADLLWIGLALNIIAVILGWWVQESPSWLVSIGRKDEALKRIEFMAKFNGVKDFVPDF